MTSLSRKTRGFAALCLLLGLAHRGDAADPGDTYAVVSLVGDALSITVYHPAVGSNIDQNDHSDVPLTDDHFDRLAARVASESIRRTVPDANVQAVVLADPAHAAADDAPALVAAVRPLLATADTRFLLIIGKYRGNAQLRVTNGTIGSGKLSGLGFYVDASKRMRKSSTGERGRGFIAPYAYMTVSLVDLRTGAIVRTETAIESATRANVGGDATLDPWTVLTSDEKVRLLDAVVGRALRRAVPQVVAPT